MIKPISPCKPDCPDRTEVCRLSCPLLHLYETERQKYYDSKQTELAPDLFIAEQAVKVIRRQELYKKRNGRY